MERFDLTPTFFTGYSLIDTPVGQHGISVPQPEESVTVYDGTTLTRFLFKEGGQPFRYREFLRENRIGSAFELEAGRRVTVKQYQKSFSGHIEA